MPHFKIQCVEQPISMPFFPEPSYPTNIINVKICEDGYLFHFHTKQVQMELQKYSLYIRIIHRHTIYIKTYNIHLI